MYKVIEGNITLVRNKTIIGLKYRIMIENMSRMFG